ncbi:MAG: hypothetical protein Q8M26_16850 [Pseudolabrys sp.]|nr:hypothetical protein [Pseudolabrys sp.]
MTTLVPSAPLHAQFDDGLSIMQPEPYQPGVGPAYRSPPELNRMQPTPRMPSLPQRPSAPPPPIAVPQTGAVLPNMPTISGSGPGGTETAQDRAVRCAHQAGAYGDAAGDRNAYIGSCVTQ